MEELVGEHVVIDGKDLSCLVLCGHSSEEFPEDGKEQGVFRLAVGGECCLDGAWKVAEVGLRRVVQKTAVLDKGAVPPRLCLKAAGDAVLSHGVEVRNVPVSAAEEGQGVGDVPKFNIFLLWMKGIHVLSGCGGDETHGQNLSFPLTEGLRYGSLVGGRHSSVGILQKEPGRL